MLQSLFKVVSGKLTPVKSTWVTYFLNSVGVNTISPLTDFQVASTSAATARGISSTQHSTDNNEAVFAFAKSRGTNAVPLAIVTADKLGTIAFAGYFNGTYTQSAYIRVVTEGTLGAGVIPSNMQFATANAAGTITEAMRITSAQSVGINITTPATRLHVAETITTSPRGIMSSQHCDSDNSARIHGRKSRGTITAPAAILTGDLLTRWVGSGYVGATNGYIEMASIDFVATGTVADTSTGRLPTYMQFNTATDASPSVLTPRMTINNLGYVSICNPNNSNSCTFSIIKSGYPSLYIGDGTTDAEFIYDTSLFMLSLTSKGYAGGINMNYGFYMPATGSSALSTDHPIGLGTISPTKSLSFGGNYARTIWLERNTITAAPGNNLTIQAGGCYTGGTDLNGGINIVSPGISTGTGMSSVRLQRLSRAATPASPGTADNSLYDAVIIPSEKNLTNAVATSLFEVLLPSNSMTGGSIEYVISATDGTDFQTRSSGLVLYDAINKAAVITAHVIDSWGGVALVTIGTLVPVWSVDTSVAGKVTIKVTVTSLGLGVITSFKIYYKIHNGSNQSITQL